MRLFKITFPNPGRDFMWVENRQISIISSRTGRKGLAIICLLPTFDAYGILNFNHFDFWVYPEP